MGDRRHGTELEKPPRGRALPHALGPYGTALTSPSLFLDQYHPLRDDYDRLERLMRAMGGGLWDYDIDARVLVCNARWYDIFGLDPAVSLVDSAEAFKRHVHPDDRALVPRFDRRALAGMIDADQHLRADYRIVRPDGDVRWVRSVAYVVRDGVTGHARAIGCVTDITEFRTNGAWPLLPAPADPSEGFSAVVIASEPVAPDAAQGDVGDPLTLKERECLLWVSAGKTAWETAVIIQRSQRTVEFHLNNAVRKLDAANKVHAATIAIRRGLL